MRRKEGKRRMRKKNEEGADRRGIGRETSLANDGKIRRIRKDKREE